MTAPVKNTLVMIMAGGKGSRLGPLTVHRSKPGVPFAGRYRIIDFVLSNFVNSGYRKIYVLTQYMSSSLIKHLSRNWRLSGFGEYIEVVPAQMRLGEFWYRGTADAVYQNLNLVRDARAEHVCVFGGDHVYKFAVDQMEAFHRDNDADLTVAAFPVPTGEASAFGIIDIDEAGRIRNFIEKPKQPPEMPGRPGWSLVSMGNYIFRRDVLERVLVDDGGMPSSRHDFGRDIIPRLVSQGARVFVYDFAQNHIPGEPDDAGPYWRDVGTIDSYFTSNMELRARVPALDLYNRQWRIRSAQRDYPPARFVRAGEG
ncbi:MAG TPA: sugar phosphate nucleotidyltransferase, partial [Kofleriaceae bacterium]|nr:sugar phosphate nucleotidyltransferase [Kofleriaceae bacterium]